MSLLQLTNELLQLENAMESPEAILPIIQQKVDGCVNYTQTLDAQIAFLKQKELEIKTMRQQLERKADKFQSYVLMCLDNLQVKSIEGEIYSVSARKPLKKVEVIDQAAIPDHFKAIKTEEIVDKAGIKKAIEAGVQIDGVRLVDGERSLTIKGRL